MTTQIIGTGSYLPKKVIDNEYLSTIVDTNDEWITTRTGIRERHIAEGEETTLYMAATAAKKALEDAGVAPEELDMILVATMSPDDVLPNLACSVQGEIGAVNAFCFDINAACTGFIYALTAAHTYIQSGMYQKALVIGIERLSRLVDWSDRGTCILFGDGAGAAVVQAGEQGMIDQVLRSDGAKGNVLHCANYRDNTKPIEYLSMQGQEVFKFAVKRVPESIQQLLERNKLQAEDIKYFVLHQANERIIKSVATRLGAGLEKFPSNVQYCGNTSAASIPILLDEMSRKGMLQRGDKIVMSGFGGGLTWGSILLEW